jgi:hypothetical protein
MKSNVDRVTDYVLDNAKELPAGKISALAHVIKALGTEVKEEPNIVPDQPDFMLADEEAPLEINKINKVIVDGHTRPVNIVSN